MDEGEGGKEAKEGNDNCLGDDIAGDDRNNGLLPASSVAVTLRYSPDAVKKCSERRRSNFSGSFLWTRQTTLFLYVKLASRRSLRCLPNKARLLLQCFVKVVLGLHRKERMARRVSKGRRSSLNLPLRITFYERR